MADPAIKVLVVDDHPAVRHGLALFVNSIADFVCVADAANGEAAIDLCAIHQPDVVLMDLVMPVMDGAQATAVIRRQFPRIQVVILTSFEEPHQIQEALRAGAISFLTKTSSVELIERAIRMARAGQVLLGPEASSAMLHSLHERAPEELTERELEILTLMVAGLKNQEIAERLFLALPTVKFHVTHILVKLGVSTRTQAVALALNRRLVRAA